MEIIKKIKINNVTIEKDRYKSDSIDSDKKNGCC